MKIKVEALSNGYEEKADIEVTGGNQEGDVTIGFSNSNHNYIVEAKALIKALEAFIK